MSYYRTCPDCGAALDPCEVCDCQDKKEAAPVLQHRNGKAEQKSHELQSSALSLSKGEGKCQE